VELNADDIDGSKKSERGSNDARSHLGVNVDDIGTQT
jgi:hypothetical protein